MSVFVIHLGKEIIVSMRIIILSGFCFFTKNNDIKMQRQCWKPSTILKTFKFTNIPLNEDLAIHRTNGYFGKTFLWQTFENSYIYKLIQAITFRKTFVQGCNCGLRITNQLKICHFHIPHPLANKLRMPINEKNLHRLRQS